MKKRKRDSLIVIYSIIVFIFSKIFIGLKETGSSTYKFLMICVFVAVTLILAKRNKVLKDISINIKKHNRGKRGEKIVAKKLNSIKGNNIVLNDLNLKIDGYKNQIDHLLITEQGVFNIETKNYYGMLIIDDNGKWVQQLPHTQNILSNTAIQSKLHRSTLKRILPNDYNIHDIIVLANDKTVLLGSENSDVPVVSIGKLEDYILHILYKSNNKNYDINEIKSLIENSRENKWSVLFKRIKYFIEGNKSLVTLGCILICGILLIGRYKPNNINFNNISENVIAVNSQYLLEEIDCNLIITSVIRNKYGDKLDVLIQNKSNNSIYIEAFEFKLIDDNGNESYVNKKYDSAIKCGEERNYTLDIVGKINSSNFKKIIINYNNYTDMFEKEYELITQ